MLFTHVNIVPMTSEKVIADQAVLVKGKTITAIGPAVEVGAAAGETVIDGQGAYLLPGLADMHMHTRPNWIDGTYPVSPFNLYLANGVTTIRDFGPMADDPRYILRWRDGIAEGVQPGPAIVTAGPPLFGPVADPAGTIRAQKSQGFDFAKLYSFLSKNEFQEALTAAKQAGVYTAGHIPFAVGLESALAAGMDEIAHVEELDFELIDFNRNLPIQADDWLPYIMREAITQFDIFSGIDISRLKARVAGALSKVTELICASQTPVCTTMVVGQTVFQKLFNPEMFQHRLENRFFPPAYLNRFRKGEDKHQQQFKGSEPLAVFKYEMEKMLLDELHRAGVTLLLSTDAGSGQLGVLPGYSIQRELQILVDNGFTPYEAIKTGTVNGARVIQKINGDRSFGTIESGKRADLILASQNPLNDITTLKNPLGVMAAGRWYSRDTLARLTALNGKNN